jgi:hypothetical protein
MKLVSSQYVYVNTAELDTHQSYNRFTVIIPPVLRVNAYKNELLKLYIKKASIRYDFPALTPFNNRLRINGIDQRLPEGNPSVLDLQEWFRQKGVLAQFDMIQGKFVFTGAEGSLAPLTLDLQGTDTAYRILGLQPQVYTLTAGQTLLTPFIANVSPPEIILIKTDMKTEALEIRDANATSTDILCEISMDVPSFATKVYYDHDGAFHVNLTQPLQKFECSLVDLFNKPVALQSPPFFVFCLELYRDDEASLLDTTLRHHELQKLDILSKA